MKAINLPPDTSQADDWITPLIFRIGSKFYEVMPDSTVRKMTDCEVKQLFAKSDESK